MQGLIDYYNAQVPNVKVSQQRTGGSVVLVSALNAGQGELGLAQADVVYGAYRRGTEDVRFPHSNLSAIAVLNINKLYVFVRRASEFRRIEDLRGKRVAIAERTGASELFTRIVLGAHKLSYSDVKVEFQPFEDMGRRFVDGTMDAMIIVTSATARAISSPADPGTLRLLPISDVIIRELRGEYPFVKPVVLPAEELPGQIAPVQTVGVDQLLICRKDLEEDVVYQLTTEFFAWPESAKRYMADPNLAAAAPIPLHPGAARYYREREILR
jgi:TRAP transporter TAXI family solute receptor